MIITNKVRGANDLSSNKGNGVRFIYKPFKGKPQMRPTRIS